jgi:SH3-like domain-containing protein
MSVLRAASNERRRCLVKRAAVGMIPITMKTRSLPRLTWALLILAISTPAFGEPAHYASIRRDQAFLREGPSYSHKILWVYRRRFYPVKVIGSFDAWRRVRDVEGTIGWMHHTQLSDARSAVFTGRSAMHADAAPTSKIVAVAQPGVVAKLKSCKPDRCEIEASGIDGWVDKKDIWGVDASEVF